MGTRSLIIMRTKNKDGNYVIWCIIYQQYDGYIKGVGQRLVEFLSKIKLVQGIPFGTDISNIANGSGCLFAQIISYFKTGVGGTYMVPPDNYQEEEYNYYVDINPDLTIDIIMKHGNKIIFQDNINKAPQFLKDYQ